MNIYDTSLQISFDGGGDNVARAIVFTPVSPHSRYCLDSLSGEFPASLKPRSSGYRMVIVTTDQRIKAGEVIHRLHNASVNPPVYDFRDCVDEVQECLFEYYLSKVKALKFSFYETTTVLSREDCIVSFPIAEAVAWQLLSMLREHKTLLSAKIEVQASKIIIKQL